VNAALQGRSSTVDFGGEALRFFFGTKRKIKAGSSPPLGSGSE
jgi:hypothetical protein